MSGSPMRRTQVNVVLKAQTPAEPVAHARLEPCPCERYRFALRYVAAKVAKAYGGSVTVTECPARGYHVVGEPSPSAFGLAGAKSGAFRAPYTPPTSRPSSNTAATAARRERLHAYRQATGQE